MDSGIENQKEEELGKQMSFLEHLDELRRRLIRSMIIIAIAFGFCWFASGDIYNFLAVPVQRALAEAQRRQVSVEGISGEEVITPLNNLQEGQSGRYIFDRPTQLGVGKGTSGTTVLPGASIQSVVLKDKNGNLALFTDEPIYTNSAVIPKGIKIVDLSLPTAEELSAEQRMIVTRTEESFTLYVTVSLYAAIAFSMPFLLWQVWGFISPALYRHERKYVTPFIGLSTISFVIGAAFAYYILFPPAIRYLLGLGEDFRLMLRATDYFDFITLIMLAMGVIFQMPAITYVLARIGIVSAGLLIKSWKISLVIILIVAAVVSPTGDIPNMMLFATPMMFLYLISIFIAWFFGRKRKTTES
jgi:sec-independent protein translocase protein TatC